jgi:RNA polymerase sigma-70 factor (ECF subfamily)
MGGVATEVASLNCTLPVPAIPLDENARVMEVPDRIHQISERLAVLNAQQGSREAFSTLVELYDRRLLYFIRRILGETNSALDVLQSVWLIVHRKLRTLKTPDAFRVWLYRIAHDQAVTELRRKSKRPVAVDDVEMPHFVAESTSEVAFESAELVHLALKDLSVDHRRVLTLRFLEDMSIDEIAEVVGHNSGTIKSRLHYAKDALRRRIEELTDA